MNLVGKILTILIFAVSIAFMMLAAAVFATHRNWREVVLRAEATADGQPRGLKLEIEDIAKTNGQLQAEIDRGKDRLALEQAARRFALAALQSQLTILEAERDSSEAQLREVQSENGVLVETLNTNQIVLEKMTEEVNKLRGESREARQARDAKYAEVLQLTEQLNGIESNLQQMRERHTQLLAQVSRMKHVLDRNELTEFDPVDNRPPSVDGIVTAVGSDMIEISIGADDGLRQGHMLEVFRRNSYLGRIVIQHTQPDKAVGKILPEYRKGTIKKGDRVATKLS